MKGHKKLFFILLALTLFGGLDLCADEGMWMVNLLYGRLAEQMKAEGLNLPPGVIYDEEAASLKDAIVALDFGCTGSLISDKGLMITNHHCAYSDVHSLSTDEHNYLEDGFWAMKSSEEIPIPGKGIYFLKKVIDVTDEVADIQAEARRLTGRDYGGRKLASVIEGRYKTPGMEVSLATMWKGEKQYMFFYEVYKDVRLVAAPPVRIGAFGGDEDNWEWPQQKGDFAMYRIYASPDGSPSAGYDPANVPMRPLRHLAINAKGLHDGDYTMVMGYPYTTNRYVNSWDVDMESKVIGPMAAELRGTNMKMMTAAMESGPHARLIYSDSFFSLSNQQELEEGESEKLTLYGVADRLRGREAELQAWIKEDPERIARWGSLLADMASLQEKTSHARQQVEALRETLIRRGSLFIAISRLDGIINGAIKIQPIKMSDDQNIPALPKNQFDRIPDMDSAYEGECFRYAVSRMAELVAPENRGAWFNDLLDRFDGDAEAMAAWAWDNSIFSSKEAFESWYHRPKKGGSLRNDPVWRIFKSTSIGELNGKVSDIETAAGHTLSDLRREYTIAMYRMRMDKGEAQYPDANSTMRLTYGTVGALEPKDGVLCLSHTTTAGVLEKNDPARYDFDIDDRLEQLLREGDWGPWGDADGTMHVNFLSDNDITGGNSGSPVMDADGNLVGLAFDGNKESLCSNYWFHPDMCKCVNVDIRYVLWILDRYAGMNYLFDEMDIIKP